MPLASGHMASQASNVRRAAVSALRAWAKGHVYMDSLIERQAAKNGLSKQDRALLQAIVSAVLRNRRLLDHWIAKLRKGKLDHETRDFGTNNLRPVPIRVSA